MAVGAFAHPFVSTRTLGPHQRWTYDWHPACLYPGMTFSSYLSASYASWALAFVATQTSWYLPMWQTFALVAYFAIVAAYATDMDQAELREIRGY